MPDRIDFNGKVAIVTGAGRGIGAAYAIELGRRGAKVVVNDPGVATDGRGTDAAPATQIADKIRAAGGEAIADVSDITDRAQARALVHNAANRWGAVHVLINNAGILRDKTFAKKDLDDFFAVLQVHLNGTVNVTHAAWPLMCERQYGRILLTTSISGTLGSFGQADYSAAKAGIMGLMNTLALEGARKNVRVNAISPAAATRMGEGQMSASAVQQFRPELVVPAALFLVSEEAPTKVALQAGGGMFSRVLFAQTDEIALPNATVESVAAAFPQIDNGRLSPVRAPEVHA